MTQAKSTPSVDRSIYRDGVLVEYDGHDVIGRKVARRSLVCRTCRTRFRVGKDTVLCNHRARCPTCSPTKMQLLLRFLLQQDGPVLWQDFVVGVWAANPAAFSLAGHEYPDSHMVMALVSKAIRRRLIRRTRPGHYQIVTGETV